MSQATNWTQTSFYRAKNEKDTRTVKTATKRNKLVYFASSKLVFICQCQGKFIQIKVSVH